MEITIAGASGMIGSALARSMEDGGHTVRRLVRRGTGLPHCHFWDPATGSIDQAAIEGSEAVINLAGTSIAGGRWTEARKRQLRDSRVLSTELLVRAIAESKSRPAVLVNASGIGYYGTNPEGWVDESSPAGDGFLAQLCQEWERAADAAMETGVRVVKLRLGVVIAREGGALAKMLPVFKAGLGGPIGGGQMWMSWVSIADILPVVERVIADTRLVGGVNAVSPAPVTNAEFARSLARVLRRPAFLPVPAWVLRIALGQMAVETILASARARPRLLLEAGFEFRHGLLDSALESALRRVA